MVPFAAGRFTTVVGHACSSRLVEVTDMAEEDASCQGLVSIVGNMVQAGYAASAGVSCWL